jgi:hypothetical protein
MRQTGVRLAVTAVVLVVLATACGDDSGSPFASSTTAGGASTTAGGVTTTDGGEGTTTAGETTTTEGGATIGPGGAAGDVEELLARFRQVPLRTTYLVGSGSDRQEMTFSQDPTQDPPVSAVVFPDGKMLTVGDRYIICSGEGAGSQCFEMPATEGVDMASAMLGPFAALAWSLQGSADLPGYEVETEQVTIGGRTGVCFTYRPAAVTGSTTEFVRQCIDSDLGFALLLEIKEAGSDEVERVMELVSAGDPEPGDFEPTGPLMTMPEG